MLEEAEVVCEYCAATGQVCNPDTFQALEVNVAVEQTRESAIQALVALWGEGSPRITEERIATSLAYPVYDTVLREMCDNHYKYCEWCEDAYSVGVPEVDITARFRGWTHEGWTYDEMLCRSCSDEAGECEDCGTLCNYSELTTVNWDYSWCESCLDDAEYCVECGMHFRLGNHRCSNRTPSASNGQRIECYSYRPAPVFRWIEEKDGDCSARARRNATPFMGFELEVELNGADAEEALQLCVDNLGEVAYYKQDGSLTDGFEIVTHPMTLAAHKQLIDWDFTTKLSNLGVRSWVPKTCGLHVHIQRSAFRSSVHLATFQYLILNNEEQMTKLAGRKASHWAKFEGVKRNVIPNIKGHSYRDRYEAINVLNANTLEIRMFRGSLMAERVLMALELVNAAFEYTRTLTSNAYINGACDFARFAAWTAGKEEYVNLNEYIIRLEVL